MVNVAMENCSYNSSCPLREEFLCSSTSLFPFSTVFFLFLKTFSYFCKRGEGLSGSCHFIILFRSHFLKFHESSDQGLTTSTL